MITIPAIILNGNELLNRNLPKKVADAPKIINTIENPAVNKIIGNKLIFFFSNNSLRELPEIYEIYPGIKGNTHGDKKLINPAPKAINISAITVQLTFDTKMGILNI